MQKTFFVLALLMCQLSSNLYAQSIQLAEEYFYRDEFEKAKESYQPYIYKKRTLNQVFPKYSKVLLNLNQYKELEQYTSNLLKKDPDNYKYQCALSNVHHKEGNKKKFRKSDKVLIQKYKDQSHLISRVLNELRNYQLFDLSEEFIKAIRIHQKNDYAYAIDLAKIYLIKDKKLEMINEYLNLIISEGHIYKVKNALQDALQTPEDYTLLEETLLEKIQKDPEEKLYTDLIMWLYIQRKDFFKAFIQARALDRRLKTEGKHVLNLSYIALYNKDYKMAQKCCQYVIDKYPKGIRKSTAYRYLIKAKQASVEQKYPVDKEEVRSLINDYNAYFEKVGRNANTAMALSDMALLYGLHLDEKDSAVAILKEAIKLSSYRPMLAARYKIHIGDIFLLKEQPWEASLFYSQAEKMAKNSTVAHDAKLKNAKLHYYKGHFKLALSHLDALKIATTKEIANDALDLSLLIRDNIGSDSTNSALKDYAHVELLLFENKHKEATSMLDSMTLKYKDNGIIDEIYWLKGNLYYKTHEYEKANEMFLIIVKNYGFDIYNDDAHFMAAKIYEEHLDNKEKAMDMYKNHLMRYPGSIFCAEARKRFRKLRGDKLDEEEEEEEK